MPRKGQNIYKRKDGRWEGRYIKFRSEENAIQYGYVYAKTYRDVREKLQTAVRTHPKPSPRKKAEASVSFQMIAEEWLDGKKPFLKESTCVRYHNILTKHLLPAFGADSIALVTDDRVEKFRNELLAGTGEQTQGLSPASVAAILSLLRSIQRYAVLRKPEEGGTVHGISVKRQVNPMRVLSHSEQEVLSRYLNDTRSLSNLGILFSLFTGVRVGELCALKWKDISFDDKTAHIHQTLQRLQDKSCGTEKTHIVISSPKSDCSERIIPLPEWLVEMLRTQSMPPDSFFLTGSTDRYVEPRTMENRFNRIMKRCNIQNAHFHTLRHTFATRCVEAGFDAKSLSEILGHSSVSITLNRYVHPSMNLKRENMSRLKSPMEDKEAAI